MKIRTFAPWRCSSMDRMKVSGTLDKGSIPFSATQQKAGISSMPAFLFSAKPRVCLL